MLAALIVLGAGAARAEIKGHEVRYEGGGVTMKGYVAYDDAVAGKRPGVIVVHEWWGHNEYARKRARQLAEMGYVGFAIDMYGDGKTADHPNDAGKFAGETMKNFPAAKEKFLAALKLLREQPQTDPAKVAAIGYCFGGGVVLNMARAGTDLAGVASFHGSLGAATEAKAGGIKAKILVCHGADDKFVSPEQIAAFKKEMKDAGADLTWKEYAGAKHGFTNPDADELGKKFGLDIAFQKAADLASWSDLTTFLDRLFK
jgi:dienelactone hydrolase